MSNLGHEANTNIDEQTRGRARKSTVILCVPNVYHRLRGISKIWDVCKPHVLLSGIIENTWLCFPILAQDCA
jgi:hypothetical protein